MHEPWVLMLAMGLGGVLTFATRAVFLLGGERLSLGPRFGVLLTYVPPAILAALIAPEVFVQGGELALGWHNPRVGAGLLAALTAFYTRSVLLTIALGLLGLWGLQAI